MTTATQARNRCHYARRLSAALGDGSRWEFRGECTELPRADGRCACGHHGLRYLFTLHHKDDGRTAIVGTVCVTQYAGITPATLAAVEAAADRLEAAAADRARAAREAARADAVAAAMAELTAAHYAIDEACQAWRDLHPGQSWAPYHVYRRQQAAARLADRKPVHPYVRLPELRTAAGIVARLRREIRAAADVLCQVRAYA
jgi:hypothetical protein